MPSRDNPVVDRAIFFLSLTSPTSGERRLAIALIAISATIFLAIAPFAHTQLAAIPAFIPAQQSALFISDLITAILLFGQFSILHTRGLLFLANAYLFTALIMVPHTLVFPGVLAPGGLPSAGSDTAAWLYIAWHSAFPLLMVGYAFTARKDTPIARPRMAVTTSVLTVAAVVAALVVIAGEAGLPRIFVNGRYTPFAIGVMAVVFSFSVMACAALLWRRPYSTLDLWMIVVTSAWLFEVGTISLLIGGRYDLGYYAGRIYGLFAASFVLIMLLREARKLYVRLASSLVAERDVAAERAEQSAETLSAVVDGSSHAIIALSRQGTVLLWNKTAERIFGYTAAEVVGRPYPLMPAQERSSQRDLFNRLAGGETLHNQVFRCQRKDGSLPEIRGSGAPYHQASGAVAGIAIALEDVTEQLATEAMLRQAQKMEAVGQLTGGIAHDFNNILMVIMASVEALQEENDLPAEQRSHVDRIAASALRATQLTRRLLAFSRRQRLHPQATNLNDLVAGIGQLLQRTLGEKIEVVQATAKDLGTASVDRGQLEATLVNLCVNARDAMPGGGRLVIETGNAELDQAYAVQNPGVIPGEYVVLSVSDTGTGIPPALMEKVFEPFFTTKGVGKGTGLGLSMVYGFIRQSNGHIKIYSDIGRGTTIRMYLPRSDAIASVDNPVAIAEPIRGGERILLVEDDAAVRASVSDQLASLGYAVTEAADGRAGLSCFEQGPPFDLMLTDVVMGGGLDGPQLAEIVAERWPGTKVLFMSGYSEKTAIDRDRISSDAQILAKPFRKIDLANRLRDALDERPTSRSTPLHPNDADFPQ